jgi:Vault protein inter-alpha-trypsin domain
MKPRYLNTLMTRVTPRVALAALATLSVGAATTFAQLDVSALYTQTVKANQPFAQIETQVESVDVKVEVNKGVATTQVTFAYTPSNGMTREWRCLATPCARPETTVTPDGKEIGNTCPQVCDYYNQSTLALDSLETVTQFQLAANGIVTDMTLWVGDVPVKAALQDRALASAQYESIVQRRRDPALLETWGNGYYNLRIFPNESGATRKLHVEFVQGLEQEGDVIAAVLPVLHRLAKISAIYTTQAEYDKLPNRTVGLFRVEAVSVDGQSYDLDWPGLGKGKVSSTPLKLEAKNISEVGEGKLSAPTGCASCLKPWVAEVTRFGTRSGYFGVKSTLIAKQLKFSEEPNERHVVLDMHHDAKDAKSADRARKIALLALKTYAVAPYTANVGFADGKGGIAYVFDKPLSMGTTELTKAYEALLEWAPGASSSAENTLRAFAQKRGQATDPCALFFIGNDTAAYFNWGTVWNEASQKEWEKFESAQKAKDSALAMTLKSAKVTLFGFWNNYRLSSVATQTGGYQMGSLYAYGYYYPQITATGQVVDPMAQLQLPPLFGPGRYDSYAITDLKVTFASGQVSEVVVLDEFPNYGIYALRGGIAVDMMLAKKSSLAKSASMLPWYGNIKRDTSIIRIAGQYQGSGRVTGEITGLWGGLTFSQAIEIDLPASAGSGAKGAGIWAYQKSEVLGRDYLTDNVTAVQTLGKDYHIVNRQMSLLALEPGMQLWTEMPSSQGTTASGAERASTTSADMAAPAGAGAIDQVTLQSILENYVPILQGVSARAAKPGAIVARQMGRQVELSWAMNAGIGEGLGGTSGEAEFRIVHVTGREVAKLTGKRHTQGFTATWAAPKASGRYFVIARFGKHMRIETVTVQTNP